MAAHRTLGSFGPNSQNQKKAKLEKEYFGIRADRDQLQVRSSQKQTLGIILGHLCLLREKAQNVRQQSDTLFKELYEAGLEDIIIRKLVALLGLNETQNILKIIEKTNRFNDDVLETIGNKRTELSQIEETIKREGIEEIKYNLPLYLYDSVDLIITETTKNILNKEIHEEVSSSSDIEIEVESYSGAHAQKIFGKR